jgi:hypothetical protein
LLGHALDSSRPPSAFISTSQSANVAASFADNVYVVRPTGGINVNQVFLGRSVRSPTSWRLPFPGALLRPMFARLHCQTRAFPYLTRTGTDERSKDHQGSSC